MSRPILIVAAVLAVFIASGWRTTSDATREDDARREVRSAAVDSFKMEKRIDDLEARIRKLEQR